MTEVYDHNKKAGNEGDICKHPALIAALDETVAQTCRRPFKYADIFAGYAKNPLRKGCEWPQGIGLVAGQHLVGGNSHVSLWAEWSGLSGAPTLSSAYPGSAWFAREVCKRRAIPFELWLWETSVAPYDDLTTTFQAHVFNTAADHRDSAIQNADFVFIDPPNKTHWAEISELIRCLDSKRGVLVWLPLGADTTEAPPGEDNASCRCRDEALELGMHVTTIRWARGGHTIGCQLLYRVNANARCALRNAVEEIICVAQVKKGASPKWGYPATHYEP